MPTVLMTLCILSCSTHTESPVSTHPNIIGVTPAVVDGLSSEDEQQQPFEDEQ